MKLNIDISVMHTNLNATNQSYNLFQQHLKLTENTTFQAYTRPHSTLLFCSQHPLQLTPPIPEPKTGLGEVGYSN